MHGEVHGLSRIYVEFDGINQIGLVCEEVSREIGEIESAFRETAFHLDWDVQREADIANAARKIMRKLQQYRDCLTDFQNFIEDAYNEYAKLDKWGDDASLGSKGGGFLFSTEQEEFLSSVKSVFKALDKWWGKKKAGMIAEGISYIEDGFDFFLGDKKGDFGGYCKMVDASTGVWSALYQYLKDKNKNSKSKWFGEAAQRTEGIIGSVGSLAGLIGTILEAFDEKEEKTWQDVMADVTEAAGKEGISWVQSIYDLNHASDKNSLTKSKAGPWSAWNIYGAIGEGMATAASQGLRNAQKYLEDGSWSVKDTGALMVDVSVGGIYGIGHSLTLGLDDVVYGAIAKFASHGHEANTDLSYYEQAAEGYKILAKKIADFFNGRAKG